MNEISQFSYGISVLEISYVIASVLFVIGLKMLSHPLSARRGNSLAAIGMGMAIIATILFHQKDGKPIGNIGFILAAIGIGTVIGWVIAKKVKMTAMPQLVSFFNGMGGAAAALISIMAFFSSASSFGSKKTLSLFTHSSSCCFKSLSSLSAIS
jgi:NAD(P) transhydrogenase subunit beta